MRFSITYKLVLGYLILGLLLAFPTLYGLYVLQEITEQAQRQADPPFEAVSTLRKMQVHLISMEQCERRFTQNPGAGGDLLDLFQYHRGQFEESLRRLQRLPSPAQEALLELGDLYSRYLDAVEEQLELLSRGDQQAAMQRSVTLLSRQNTQLASRLDALVVEIKQPGVGRMATVVQRGTEASWKIILLSVAAALLGLGSVLVASLRISSSLTKLKEATLMIAEGSFDLDPQIRSRDELGDLSQHLSLMARKVKQYQELCLDASPLTRLPGNIAIERALMEKIRKGEKFALCYIDLDNFKAFNDAYGYAKGSEVIKATGEVVHEAQRLHGSADDFVGHIGGDDFVLITSPDNVNNVCESIIREFDAVIPDFYTPADRERGFLEGTDRYGVTRRFPIMTISIAVVSDARRDIKSPTEIAQVASEIKDFAKDLPGSNYIIDRRRGGR